PIHTLFGASQRMRYSAVSSSPFINGTSLYDLSYCRESTVKAKCTVDVSLSRSENVTENVPAGVAGVTASASAVDSFFLLSLLQAASAATVAQRNKIFFI